MSGNFEVCPIGTQARLAAAEAEREALLAVVQAYIVWSEAEHEKDPKSTTFRERIEMCREVDELARAAIAKVKGGGNG